MRLSETVNNGRLSYGLSGGARMKRLKTRIAAAMQNGLPAADYWLRGRDNPQPHGSACSSSSDISRHGSAEQEPLRRHIRSVGGRRPQRLLLRRRLAELLTPA